MGVVPYVEQQHPLRCASKRLFNVISSVHLWDCSDHSLKVTKPPSEVQPSTVNLRCAQWFRP